MGELKRRILRLISGGSGPSDGARPDLPQSHQSRDVPSVGTVLRSARVEAGLELRDVATMLKIRFVFMQAIEDGRYHELPGTAYAVGFVRAYADYLGLDSEAVVYRFKEEVAGKVGQQNLYFPTPVPEGKIPGGTVLLFSVILICLVYGGWYVLSATDRSIVDMVPALPQRLVTLLDAFSHGSAPSNGTTTAPAPGAAPGPAGVAATPAAESAVPAPSPAPVPAPAPGAEGAAAPALPGGVVLKPAAPGEARPGMSLPLAGVPAPAGSPASPPTATDTGTNDPGDEIPLVSGPTDEAIGGPGPLVPMAPRVKPARPGAQPPASPTADGTPAPAAAPVPVAADGRVFGSQSRESRVVIRATQDTWVQIRDASGEAIFTRVLQPGEVFRVPDRPGLRLRTGNAGGLTAIVDGGDAVPLGQIGQVLRDVPVDPARLRNAGASE